MRLDRRGIETLSLCALLGILGVSTAVVGRNTEPTTTPYLSAEVVATDGNTLMELNAGTSISFSVEGANALTASATTESTAPEVVAMAAPSEWANKCMLNAQSVNIREAASADSAIVGKLFEGGAADVLERNGEWTKISSGSVEGYIATEYLVFGDEAEALANEKGSYITTVQSNSVRVREAADASSKSLGLVGSGEQLKARNRGENENGFVAIEYKGKAGYISAEFVTTEFILGKAKSVEEIKAEEKAKAEAEAKKKAAQKAAEVSQGAAVAANADEVSLLAALIQCEAGGQSHAGKLAVGAVVMNRVKSGAYPNSIYNVIYQRGQFPPASVTGKVANVLANHSYNSDCVAAAREAISGISNVGNAIGFASASSGRAGVVIGPVVFF